jgi:hypothetical protein
MASEYQQAMRDIAKKVVQYVDDVSSMTVETKYVLVGESGELDFDSAKPAARTIIRLDGDNETIVPTRLGDNGTREIDFGIFELHQGNVDTAIEYRAEVLRSLLEMVQR